MDVVDTKLGSEGSLDIKLEGGKLVISISHVHASGELSLMVKEDVKYFLEKLKAAIPGKFDDIVIDVVEGVLP